VAPTTTIPAKVLGRYASGGAAPVDAVRHDPDKLGPVLCDLATRPRDIARISRLAAAV
jgi:hypothetical protein